jgi:hypothetical protein
MKKKEILDEIIDDENNLIGNDDIPENGSRIDFQKHKLKNKLDFYNKNLTEIENMKLNNYHRIFDCGNIKYLYKNTL